MANEQQQNQKSDAFGVKEVSDAEKMYDEFVNDERRKGMMNKIDNMRQNSDDCLETLAVQLRQCDNCVMWISCQVHDDLIWQLHNYVSTFAAQLRDVKSLRVNKY